MVIARPTTSTTYIVVGRTAGGCVGTDTVVVNVIDGPRVDAGLDKSICYGDAVRLTASVTADAFTWAPTTGLNDPEQLTPVASPLSTTTYRLTATRNGCIVTDSVTVVVSNIVLTVGNDVDVCLGSGIELNAQGAVTYRWDPPTGLSDPSIPNPIASPAVTTRYRVIGTDLIGCVDTTYVDVRVIDTVNISLEVGITTAAAGNDSTTIPIYINVNESDIPVMITRLRAAFVHDASAYLPERSDRGQIVSALRGNERVSYFEVRNQLITSPRQRISSIIGTALLGYVDELPIRIEDATWDGIVCPVTTSIDGRLFITGCNLRERVLRVFNPTRTIVQPRAGSDIIDVTIEGGEPGAFLVQLVSVDGRASHQTTLSRGLGDDQPLTTYIDMTTMPTGLYHVVILAPSGPHVSRVLWMK